MGWLIDIAQAVEIKPIAQAAEGIGILPGELEFYGPYKGKVKLEILERLKDAPTRRGRNSLLPPGRAACRRLKGRG